MTVAPWHALTALQKVYIKLVSIIALIHLWLEEQYLSAILFRNWILFTRNTYISSFLGLGTNFIHSRFWKFASIQLRAVRCDMWGDDLRSIHKIE